MQKISRLTIAVIAFFAISLGLWSCQWHTIEPIKVDVIIDTTGVDPVSFSTEIQPIFNSECNDCHNNTSPKLTSDVSYNNLINGNYVNTTEPASSVIITKITGGHYGSYNTAQQTLILTWITQGANNN